MLYSKMTAMQMHCITSYPPITTTQQHSYLRLVAWTYSLYTPNPPNGPLGYIEVPEW